MLKAVSKIVLNDSTTAVINSVIINKVFASYITVKWNYIECIAKFTVRKTQLLEEQYCH